MVPVSSLAGDGLGPGIRCPPDTIARFRVGNWSVNKGPLGSWVDSPPGPTTSLTGGYNRLNSPKEGNQCFTQHSLPHSHAHAVHTSG